MIGALKHKTQNAGSSTKNSPFFSPSTIQPKLTIGQPNDKYEQEADAMADKVMRMPKDGSRIQRECSDCGEEEVQAKPQGNFLSKMTSVQRKANGSESFASSALSTQLKNTKGSGTSLPDSTNQFMSNAFGNDFSPVRIHTGSKAIQMNQDLNARAFTHGSDVYFNKGEYSPNSSGGKNLLAHELTHVVQQGGSNSLKRKKKNNSIINSQTNKPYIHRYFKKTFGGLGYRVSSDKKMAVKQVDNFPARRTFFGSKYFYAKPGLIGASTKTLKGQKSALELSSLGAGRSLILEPGSPAVSGDIISSPRFKGDARLEAIMRKERKKFLWKGTRGETVKTIQKALLAAGIPLKKYGADGKLEGETIAAVKVFQTKVGLSGKAVDGIVGNVTMGHLDKYFGGGAKAAVPDKTLNRISAKNLVTGTSGTSMKIEDDCGGAAKTIMFGKKAGFNSGYAQGGRNIKGVYKVAGVDVETPVFTRSDQVRDYIIKKIMNTRTISRAKSDYWKKTAVERNIIDRNAGINNYANVKTGESHSIVSGDNTPYSYNWHWGAVIMSSGSDKVTMENFANSGKNAWRFQMYGAGSQAFHTEQKKRLTRHHTAEYGHKPITVRIKPA